MALCGVGTVPSGFSAPGGLLGRSTALGVPQARVAWVPVFPGPLPSGISEASSLTAPFYRGGN